MILLAIALSLLLRASHASTTLNVMDLGAKGDGKVLDNHAVIAAFAICSRDPPPSFPCIVNFPSPHKFLLSPFNVSSNTVLNIERGALLIASDDFLLWQTIAALPSYPSGREMAGPRYEPFIGGDGVWNFSITGGGEIDGQGQAWWRAHKNKILNYTRGHLFELRRCGNLLLTNVTFRNSPFWTLHPWACSGVTVTHCGIHAPLDSPNTDGFDPDSCSDVVFAHNTVSSGDDHVSIKSGMNLPGVRFNMASERILIEHNVFETGAGVSIGSEMSGSVRHIIIQHNLFTASQYGFNVKSGRGRGGEVRDVLFAHNIVALAISEVIRINMYYSSQPAPGPPETTPSFSNISIVNVTAAGLRSGIIRCLPESPCHALFFQDVRIFDTMPYKCDPPGLVRNSSFINTHPAPECIIDVY